MKALILSLSLLAAAPAFAVSGDYPASCEFESNGQKAELNLVVGEGNVYSGRLFVGKDELKPLGPCYRQTEPGRTGAGLRCSFSDGSTRFELYPSFGGVQVIAWPKNGKAQTLQGSCR